MKILPPAHRFQGNTQYTFPFREVLEAPIDTTEGFAAVCERNELVREVTCQEVVLGVARPEAMPYSDELMFYVTNGDPVLIATNRIKWEMESGGGWKRNMAAEWSDWLLPTRMEERSVGTMQTSRDFAYKNLEKIREKITSMADNSNVVISSKLYALNRELSSLSVLPEEQRESKVRDILRNNNVFNLVASVYLDELNRPLADDMAEHFGQGDNPRYKVRLLAHTYNMGPKTTWHLEDHNRWLLAAQKLDVFNLEVDGETTNIQAEVARLNSYSNRRKKQGRLTAWVSKLRVSPHRKTVYAVIEKLESGDISDELQASLTAAGIGTHELLMARTAAYAAPSAKDLLSKDHDGKYVYPHYVHLAQILQSGLQINLDQPAEAYLRPKPGSPNLFGNYPAIALEKINNQ